jgi:hypothetical protein
LFETGLSILASRVVGRGRFVCLGNGHAIFFDRGLKRRNFRRLSSQSGQSVNNRFIKTQNFVRVREEAVFANMAFKKRRFWEIYIGNGFLG